MLAAGTKDTMTFPSYDGDGNQLSRTDGNNVTTAYAYADPESRLTDVTYSAGTIGNVHYAYDAYGRRSQMTDGTGGQTYAYDDGDALTQKNVTWTGFAAKAVTYGFYPNGSRQSMTADGQAFSYGYDAIGRLTALTNPFGESSAWTYKANSWLATRTINNSTGNLVASTAYTYNPLGQVSELLNKSSAGATLSDYKSMVYDAVGSRTSLTASVPGAPAAYSGTTSYGYDYGQTANPALNRSQFTAETSTRATGTQSYAYDGGTAGGPGNPTSFKGVANSFNADNQQTGAGYGYDGAGNPTTYKGAALGFDPENRMTSDSTGSQADGYSGDDLRAWKQSAGSKTYFLYDGTQPVSEYSGAGTLLATNTLGASGVASRHTSAGSTFYAFDERGNVSQRLSSAGAVQSSELYDAYGSRMGTAAQGDPFGYGAQAGYYADSETGLVLCTHRYYDPANGRWLTRDPMGYAGGVNLYGYVGNDPGNRWDPSGFDSGSANPIDWDGGDWTDIGNGIDKWGTGEQQAGGNIIFGGILGGFSPNWPIPGFWHKMPNGLRCKPKPTVKSVGGVFAAVGGGLWVGGTIARGVGGIIIWVESW